MEPEMILFRYKKNGEPDGEAKQITRAEVASMLRNEADAIESGQAMDISISWHIGDGSAGWEIW